MDPFHHAPNYVLFTRILSYHSEVGEKIVKKKLLMKKLFSKLVSRGNYKSQGNPFQCIWYLKKEGALIRGALNQKNTVIQNLSLTSDISIFFLSQSCFKLMFYISLHLMHGCILKPFLRIQMNVRMFVEKKKCVISNKVDE